MLNFCGENNITAEIELIKMDDINTAMKRLAKSDIRYRFVIDIANSLSSTSKIWSTLPNIHYHLLLASCKMLVNYNFDYLSLTYNAWTLLDVVFILYWAIFDQLQLLFQRQNMGFIYGKIYINIQFFTHLLWRI